MIQRLRLPPESVRRPPVAHPHPPPVARDKLADPALWRDRHATLIEALTEDKGGKTQVSATDEILIARAATLVIQLEFAEARWAASD